LNGLNALQRTSRHINQALNEEEIFQRLSPALFDDLGFARVLVITFEPEPKLRLNVGFPDTKLPSVLSSLSSDDVLKGLLKEHHAYSSINAARKAKEKLAQVFDAEHFVIAPILSQSGPVGLIFVGNRYNAPAVTQGDEELVAILAGQIGQALENAQLFEKVFRSSQELEIKVKDRTKQLASALEKVEEISKKKTEFISAVSHELRTPLTSIKGYAAILIAGKIGEIPDAVKERLAKINTHSDNLVGLINNLLDIARIESGRQEMKFSLYSAKKVTENVADLLMPQVSAKEINLKLDIPPQVNETYIDISQGERVFINLL
jgi:K+-sensing histidine kinase KdpD